MARTVSRVVECQHCLQLNTVPEKWKYRAVCDKCKKRLNSTVPWGWLLLILIGSAAYFHYGSISEMKDALVELVSTRSELSQKLESGPFAPGGTERQSEPAMEPVSVVPGVLAAFYPKEAGVAPITVIAPPGSDSFYIKLISTTDKQVALILYVGPGGTVQTLVPVGVYTMRMAAGATWYGEKQLFGPESKLTAADKDLAFTQDGLGFRGQVITLEPKMNGNLPTHQLPQSAF